MIRPNGELSVIVTRLGCESVVCLEKHTQWLCRLYVLLLFYYYLRFGHLRSEGLTLGMLIWISSYRYSYTMEEEVCLHVHFGYI